MRIGAIVALLLLFSLTPAVKGATEVIVATVVRGHNLTHVDGDSSTAGFTSPGRLAYKPDGTLVVAESRTIRLVSTTGFVTTLAGTVGLNGETDGAAANVRIENPLGVAVHPFTQEVFFTTLGIISPTKIRKVFSNGNTTVIARALGGGQFFPDRFGPLDVSDYGKLRNLAFFGTTMFVADADFGQIRNLTQRGGADDWTSGRFAGRTFVDDMPYDMADGDTFTNGTDGAAFKTPTHLAVGPTGDVFVTDQNIPTPIFTLRRISGSSVTSPFVIGAGVAAIAVASNNTVYISVPNQIIVTGGGGETPTRTFVGTGTPGQVDGDIGSASIVTPQGMAFAPCDNSLTFSEQGALPLNHGIRNIANHALTILAAQATTIGFPSVPQAFNVSAGASVATGTSSATGVIANNNITIIGGTGTQRTVSVTASTVGSAAITVGVLTCAAAQHFRTFTVTVNPLPTLTTIPNQETTVGVGITARIWVQVSGGTGALTVSATGTSNSAVLSTTTLNSLITYENGTFWFFTIPSVPTAGGTTMTLQVQDSVGAFTTTTFILIVNSPPYFRPVPNLQITQDRTGPEISCNVSAGTQPLTVTLVPHPRVTGYQVFPHDGLNQTMRITVNSPPGTYQITLRVTDRVGAAAEVVFDLTIAPTPTFFGVTTQTTTVFRPTPTIAVTMNGGTGALVLTGESSDLTNIPISHIQITPTGAFTANVVILAGGTPDLTGVTITLRVTDRDQAQASTLFLVFINGLPTIAAIPDVHTTTGFRSPLLPLLLSQGTAPLVVTAKSNNQVLLSDAAVGISEPFIWAHPAVGVPGNATVNVTVTDVRGATSSITFVVAISAHPSISQPAAQATTVLIAAGPISVTTVLGTLPLRLSATSSVPSIVPNTGAITINAGNGFAQSLDITPTDQFGVTNITITVTDGVNATVSTWFLLTVNRAPAVDPIGPRIGTVNHLTPVISFVTQFGTAPVNCAATSSNQAILADADITEDCSQLVARPIAEGAVNITVAATDFKGAVGTRTFQLQVNPVPFVSAITDRQTTQGQRSFNIPAIVTPGTPPLIVTVNSANGGALANGDITVVPNDGFSQHFFVNPQGTGVTNLTVTVTDATGAYNSAWFLLTVNARPAIAPLLDMASTNGYFSANQTVTITALGTQPTTVVWYSSNLAAVPLSAIDYISAPIVRFKPISVGTSTITLNVTDAQGAIATRSFTFTSNGIPFMSSLTEFGTTIGFNSSVQACTVGQGTAPLVVTAVSGNTGILPSNHVVILPGNGLNQHFYVFAPASTGVVTLTLTVLDSVGADAARGVQFTLNDLPQIAAISDRATGNGQASFPISAVVTLGTAPLTVTATSSNTSVLANGQIQIIVGDGTNQAIVVTPSIPGTTNVTVRVTDFVGAMSSASFILTVNPAPAINPLSDMATTVGRPTPAQTVTITSLGTEPSTIQWYSSNQAVVSNANINYTAPNVVITPATVGTALITVNVTDSVGFSAIRSFTLTSNALPTMNTLSNQATTVLRNTTAQVCAVGSGTGVLTVTAVSGNPGVLPTDRIIIMPGDGINQQVYVAPGAGFSATPVTVTLTVTDAVGAVFQRNFQVTINENPELAFIADTAITVSRSRVITLALSKGTAPLNFAGSSGNTTLILNTELTAAGNDLTVAVGQTSHTGTVLITVTVTDVAGATAQRTFTVTVNSLPVIAALSDVGSTQSIPFPPVLVNVQTGTGTPTFNYAATSSNEAVVPNANLQFTVNSLAITPATFGTAEIVVTVTDITGAVATRRFNLTQNRLPALSLSRNTVTHTLTGPAPSTVTYTALYGTLPYILPLPVSTSDSAIMPVANVNANAGVITITPTEGAAGTATLTFNLTDSYGATARQQITYTNYPLPSIPAMADVTTTAEVNWTVPIGASGGTPPLTLMAVSNSPAVVGSGRIWALSNAIVVSPSGPGAAQITVTVTDADGMMANRTFTVTVNDRPVIPVPIPNNGQTPAGTPGNMPFNLQFGTPPYRFVGTSSQQSIVRNNQISVVPTQGGGPGDFTIVIATDNGVSGTVTISVTVFDARNASVSQQFIYTINGGITPGCCDPKDDDFFGKANNLLYVVGGGVVALGLLIIACLICRRMYKDSKATESYEAHLRDEFGGVNSQASSKRSAGGSSSLASPSDAAAFDQPSVELSAALGGKA